MTPHDLPPDELAVAAKALDVHRQSLIRKLDRIGNNANERKRTMQEITSCSNAAARFREAHDAQLAQRVAS
jgi:hypothetical protein